MRQKVGGRSGMVLVLSLFYLLFCAVIGGTIVSAASTNAGRMERAQIDLETELAVRSAGNVLIGQLAESGFEGHFLMNWTSERPQGGTVTNSYSFAFDQLGGDTIGSGLGPLLPKDGLTGLFLRTAAFAGWQVADKVAYIPGDLNGIPLLAADFPMPLTVEQTFHLSISGHSGIPDVLAKVAFSTAADSRFKATLTVWNADGSHKLVWVSYPTVQELVTVHPTEWLVNSANRSTTRQSTEVTVRYEWREWKLVP